LHLDLRFDVLKKITVHFSSKKSISHPTTFRSQALVVCPMSVAPICPIAGRHAKNKKRRPISRVIGSVAFQVRSERVWKYAILRRVIKLGTDIDGGVSSQATADRSNLKCKIWSGRREGLKINDVQLDFIEWQGLEVHILIGDSIAGTLEPGASMTTTDPLIGTRFFG
jgi:hypothetical protein